MHKGTIIEDLICSVERAEKRARDEELDVLFYHYPVLQGQLSALEVA